MNASDDDFPPEISERLGQARAARLAVRAMDPEFFAAVSSAMFRHDPVGISFEDNTDEYDAEAGTVIPRLGACLSVEDVASVLHEEFSAWFGTETAGGVATYRALASEVWALKRAREA